MASHTLLLISLLLVVWQSSSTTIPLLKRCTKYSQCVSQSRNDSPSNMNSSQFDKSYCFCDPECSVMNDCCHDASPDATNHTLSTPPQYWSCVQQPHLNARHRMLYMISSCPPHHPLQDLCSGTLFDMYDYKMDIPVLSLRTGEWFKNIYCATCHGHHSDVRPTEVTLSCSGNNTPDATVLEARNYVPGALMWSGENMNCSIQIQFSDDYSSTIKPWERPCVKTIDHCPSTWQNETVAEFCRSYALFVRQDNTAYKNPHCALCNGVPLEEIKCLTTRISMRIAPRPSPSLRVIMDFSWDAAYEFCHPPDGLWDGVHECCQNLNSAACTVRSRHHSECCVPLSRRLNDSCPRIEFKQGQYRLLMNNSLEVILNDSKFSGLLLAPGEYGLLPGGNVEICNILPRGLVSLDSLQEYLTTVCLSISVICLVLHLIIHSLLPKLHNLPGKNLKSLSIAILMAQLGFLVGLTPVIDIPSHLCVTIAVLLHFSYLAAFCWMNVMSIDIWRTFSAIRLGGRLSTHLKYSLYAWGSPAIVTLLAIVAHYTSFLPSILRPHFAFGGVCWFGNRMGLAIFMATPVTVILVINILLFCRTVCVLHQKQENRRYLKKKAKVELSEATSDNKGVTSPTRKVTTGAKDQIRFYLYVKLFIIMGLSWVTGTIAVLTHLPILWYPFIVLNGLQGAFIFIMFDVKRNILAMLWDRVLGSRYPLPSILMYHSTGTTTDSSGARTTSSTNLRSSLMSDHVQLPLMSGPKEALPKRKLSRQRSATQTITEDTSMYHRTADKVGNGHFEGT
ncbi:uncharacterized protein [Anabrus simplex]|uniref:uncharacterized protein isoform X2 n=1 Tax=Anabrus simplex TaxID=316456 RepID=UPI0035A33BA2